MLEDKCMDKAVNYKIASNCPLFNVPWLQKRNSKQRKKQRYKNTNKEAALRYTTTASVLVPKIMHIHLTSQSRKNQFDELMYVSKGNLHKSDFVMCVNILQVSILVYFFLSPHADCRLHACSSARITDGEKVTYLRLFYLVFIHPCVQQSKNAVCAFQIASKLLSFTLEDSWRN